MPSADIDYYVRQIFEDSDRQTLRFTIHDTRFDQNKFMVDVNNKLSINSRRVGGSAIL